jgi:hypothetical protein
MEEEMNVSFETRAGQKIVGKLEGSAPDHCISVRVEKGPRFAKGKVLLFPKNDLGNFRQSAA